MKVTPLSLKTSSDPGQSTHINAIERWNVYYRLVDLGIPCTCTTGQPLQVEVQNPLAVIQLWSVVKQFTTSHRDKIDWLNHCWEV